MRLLATSMMAMSALASSPFSSCGDSWQRKIEQDQAKQAELPPNYCATDPPNGCAVMCPDSDVADAIGPGPEGGVLATDFCKESSAADLTQLFLTDAQTILVCDTKTMGGSYLVFPTYFLIAPTVVNTGQCVPPPPPPPTLTMKQITGQ